MERIIIIKLDIDEILIGDKMNKPRILFFDIETTPNIVTVFSLHNNESIHPQNILKERRIISIAWKYAGKSGISSVSIDPKHTNDDKDILELFSDIMKNVDVVVAHYGDEFDIKFINARLAFHNLPPLPNVIQIDTYKIARSKFYFNSNKLDYLAKFLGLGSKIRTDYELWRACMDGDEKALDRMVRYNRHDVTLLEKVYNRLAPFVKPKLKMSLSKDACDTCGSHRVHFRGTQRSLKGQSQRLQCIKCGHWQSKPIKETK